MLNSFKDGTRVMSPDTESEQPTDNEFKVSSTIISGNQSSALEVDNVTVKKEEKSSEEIEKIDILSTETSSAVVVSSMPVVS